MAEVKPNDNLPTDGDIISTTPFSCFPRPEGEGKDQEGRADTT